MFNIILASHGNMAEGMLDSIKLFFGDEIDKISALCIHAGDDPVEFDHQITSEIKKMGNENGTLIFVDMFGGTPGKRSAMILKDSGLASSIKVITGMNFTMLLEVMGLREGLNNIKDLDINALMETGRDGIKCINQVLHL